MSRLENGLRIFEQDVDEEREEVSERNDDGTSADGPEEAKEPDAAPPEAEDWSAKAEVQEGREGDVEAAPEPPRPNVVAVDDLLSGGGARDLGVLGVFCCTQGRDLLGGASPSGGAPGEPPAYEDPDAIPLTVN